MRQGKMKWYNGKKCFGFVTPDTANEQGNKEDVFVHSTALQAAGLRFLNEGDVISFDDEHRNGKLSAMNISLISRDEESAKKFQEQRSERRSHYGDRPQRSGGGYGGHRDNNRDRADRDGKGFFGKVFKK
jgi:CspA family cold shock protein